MKNKEKTIDERLKDLALPKAMEMAASADVTLDEDSAFDIAEAAVNSVAINLVDAIMEIPEDAKLVWDEVFNYERSLITERLSKGESPDLIFDYVSKHAVDIIKKLYAGDAARELANHLLEIEAVEMPISDRQRRWVTDELNREVRSD